MAHHERPLNTLLDARGRAGVLISNLTVLRANDGTALELIVHVRCGQPTSTAAQRLERSGSQDR